MHLNFVFKQALHFSTLAKKWLAWTVYVCMYNQCVVFVYRAAELVGLTIHQLMNDNTAVALNYGVFRRQEFNTTPQVCMLFV